MSKFSNQVVLITGAAGNLGQAVARAFYNCGAYVVLADHSSDRLGQIYPDLSTSSRVLFATPFDLDDPNSVRQLMARVVDRFNRIDILVNTVGGYRAGTPVHQTTLETYDLMFHINVRTAFMISQAVIPFMLSQGAGKLIHVSSKAGLTGAANGAAYSAAKSALIRLTESMAAELKDKGINVNCVIPGIIDTPQNRATIPGADVSKWVTPDAIADVILFLASNEARAIQGAAIPVTGKG
jgi:NAD(P)-dependent dehydrogenase (short-subunit alcohol dehydrogenase family)